MREREGESESESGSKSESVGERERERENARERETPAPDPTPHPARAHVQKPFRKLGAQCVGWYAAWELEKGFLDLRLGFSALGMRLGKWRRVSGSPHAATLVFEAHRLVYHSA